MMTTSDDQTEVGRDLLRYNGTFTVRSITGAHRTYKVSTWGKDRKRVVSLLTGPDNTESYTGFGFVTRAIAKDGTPTYAIVLWSKLAGVGRKFFAPRPFSIHPDDSSWATHAATLADIGLGRPESVLLNTGFTVMAEIACRKCGRPLTTPESIESGIGPICEEKEMGS